MPKSTFPVSANQAVDYFRVGDSRALEASQLKCYRTKLFRMLAQVDEQPLLLLLAAFRGQFFGNLIGNEAGTVMRHTVVDRAPGLLHGGERDPKYGGKLLVYSTFQRG